MSQVLWCSLLPFFIPMHVLALRLTFFPEGVTESMTSALLAGSVKSIPEYLAKPPCSMNVEQIQVSMGSQRKYKIN